MVASRSSIVSTSSKLDVAGSRASVRGEEPETSAVGSLAVTDTVLRPRPLRGEQGEQRRCRTVEDFDGHDVAGRANRRLPLPAEVSVPSKSASSWTRTAARTDGREIVTERGTFFLYPCHPIGSDASGRQSPVERRRLGRLAG